MFEVHFKDGQIVTMSYNDMLAIGYKPLRLGSFVALNSDEAQPIYAFTKPQAPERASVASSGGILGAPGALPGAF